MYKFNSDQLIPAIIQDYKTKDVLMLGYMNQESIDLTFETKTVWFYSRSRQKLWQKGETSGNKLMVKNISLDCDNDTLLILADPLGPTCHTGERTCFYNEILEGEQTDATILTELMTLIEERKVQRPEGSYTTYLFDKGVDKILKKVGEECAEVIIGAKNSKEELVYEMADLFYHSLVLLANQEVPLEDIFRELRGRKK